MRIIMQFEIASIGSIGELSFADTVETLPAPRDYRPLSPSHTGSGRDGGGENSIRLHR